MRVPMEVMGIGGYCTTSAPCPCSSRTAPLPRSPSSPPSITDISSFLTALTTWTIGSQWTTSCSGRWLSMSGARGPGMEYPRCSLTTSRSIPPHTAEHHLQEIEGFAQEDPVVHPTELHVLIQSCVDRGNVQVLVPCHQHHEFHVEQEPIDSGGEENSTDRKSTRLNSSHTVISYAVFCLKKKTKHCKI